MIPTKPKVISVTAELETVTNAVTAARLLVQALYQSQLGSEADEQAALPAAEAVLALTTTRLRDLRRAISGTCDPALL